MKILVLGNSASGKTALSRKLGQIHKLPVYHVDSFQFDRDLNMRPYSETLAQLKIIREMPDWIIDGYGPLDDLQNRLHEADAVIFLDWPLFKNIYWGTKRFFKVILWPRVELPNGHNELRWVHIKKFYLGLWKVHKLMRPELVKILSRPLIAPKVLRVQSGAAYRKLFKKGLPTEEQR